MAGVDYAGLAWSKKAKQWTNMGYIKHSKGLFDFHKHVKDDRNVDILQTPEHLGNDPFSGYKPGIGKITLDGNEWTFLYGYFPDDEKEYAESVLKTKIQEKKWKRIV